MVNLYNIDIMPLSRIIWKDGSDEVRNVWSKLTYECHMAELRTVSKGYRDCATFHINSQNIKDDLELLNNLGLRFVPIRAVKRVSGFAHKFYEVNPNEPYDVFGAVSTDISKAIQFRNYETKSVEKDSHIGMGKLLGYPECCIKFFIDRWFSGEYDPIWSMALNTNKVNKKSEFCLVLACEPNMNLLYRYFGVRVIPHLAHSFDCKDSIEFSKLFLDCMDKDYRDILLDLLREKCKWDCYKGVAIVDNKYFIGVANSMPYMENRVVILN